MRQTSRNLADIVGICHFDHRLGFAPVISTWGHLEVGTRRAKDLEQTLEVFAPREGQIPRSFAPQP